MEGIEAATASSPKKLIQKAEGFPKVPNNFGVKDWKQVAIDFDEFCFDFDRPGLYLPIARWDETGVNNFEKTFFLPSYIGSNNFDQPGTQESIVTLSAVIGASLAGINKASQPITYDGKTENVNFVKMTQAHYQPATDFLLDGKQTQDAGGSFWYDIMPAIFFSQLTDLYPAVDNMESIMKAVNERWYTSVYRFGGTADKLDFFNSTGYSFFE
ncbi:MAG: hypothetical protein ACYC5K_13445, partial [Saccharofermentanales bacterium]